MEPRGEDKTKLLKKEANRNLNITDIGKQFPSVGMNGEANKGKNPTRTTKTNPKLVVFPSSGTEPTSILETNDLYWGSTIGLEYPYPALQTDESLVMERPLSANLKRVTAYCNADSYNLNSLKQYFDQKSSKYSIKTYRYDEVLYTPYFFHEPAILPTYERNSMEKISSSSPPLYNTVERPFFDSSSSTIDTSVESHVVKPLDEKEPSQLPPVLFNEKMAHLFFFDYGVMVSWGLDQSQEQYLLSEILYFAKDRLPEEDIEIEALQYCHDPMSTGRMFGDIIVLKQNNFHVKLTISHALAQSVKLSIFEERLEEAITSTRHIPQLLTKTGKVHLSNVQINKKIGQLFVLRIHINLISNVLDTPEIFWAHRQWESLYKAARTYFEIPQRVEVLNHRTAVISDLLDMLKDHLTSTHGQFLEWIVIILITIEVLIGIVEIYVMASPSHLR